MNVDRHWIWAGTVSLVKVYNCNATSAKLHAYCMDPTDGHSRETVGNRYIRVVVCTE